MGRPEKMNPLVIRNLTKNFGDICAVNHANFEVTENSVFGLIGRNGAGKTTTIRMLMNIYLPDEGEIIFRGEKITHEFKDVVGYLPEERGLYKKMSVLDTLLFFAEIKGKTGSTVKRKALEYLERFELLDRASSKIQDLSKGNQQKIQFITTILHDPDFIILDEPFSGLDPINTDLLKDIILEMKEKNKVIIFSTHLMDYAEKLCDHIAMIDKGKIIVSGSMKDIKQKFSDGNITLIHEGDISFARNLPYVEKVNDFGNFTGIKVKDSLHTQEFLKELVNRNIRIDKFSANDISLHEIFVQLAGVSENETTHSWKGVGNEF